MLPAALHRLVLSERSESNGSSTPPSAPLGMTSSSRYRPFVPTEGWSDISGCHPDRESGATFHPVIPTERAERRFILSSRPRERSERVEGSIRLAKLAQDEPMGRPRVGVMDRLLATGHWVGGRAGLKPQASSLRWAGGLCVFVSSCLRRGWAGGSGFALWATP